MFYCDLVPSDSIRIIPQSRTGSIIWLPQCQSSKFKVNSLWPSDAMHRRRSWSILVHVMAYCLAAPRHYLNQCWLIINGISGIRLWVMLTWLLRVSIPRLCVQIAHLKSQPHILAANELIKLHLIITTTKQNRVHILWVILHEDFSARSRYFRLG